MSQENNMAPIPISDRRRWLLLLVPAFVSLGGLIVLIIFQFQTIPAWQVAMERYQSEQAEAGNLFSVISVVTALLPAEFGPDEPFHPVGELSGRDRDRALTYPPAEVRCVELQSEPEPDGERRIILLVKNEEDSDHADWLIYEPAGPPLSVNQAVAEIGCFFPSFEEELSP